MPGYELIGDAERDAVLSVFNESNGVLFAHGFDELRSGRYRVREFEKLFAEAAGTRYAQAVTSGTMAQYVAMKALGIGPGDQVITQAHTFVATVEVILALGAEPVIVDIDESFNMSVEGLRKAVTPETKLIIPVHMLGNPADMADISDIASAAGIPVLEDACEAFGASYRGRPVGSLGKVGIFSLDFGKTITTGEGGMIVTDDPDVFQYCREYHDHGHQSNPSVPRGRDTRSMPGLNLRMMELQGAVGMAQLRRLPDIVSGNRRNKAPLREAFAGRRNVSPRRLTDPAGDLGDTVIATFGNARLASDFVQRYNALGYGTKNIPDAVDWHFAGRWDHMFPQGSRYGGDLSGAWPNAARLISESVSLPVSSISDAVSTRAHAAAISEILRAMGVD